MTDVDAVARECAEKVIAAWDSSHPSWHDVSEPIAAALNEYGTELQSKLAAAESRAAELDAQAGELREALSKYVDFHRDHCMLRDVNDATLQVREENANRVDAALSSTAGLSTLARVKELEGQVAELKSRPPMQPIERDSRGVIRFRVNPIVRLLLDDGRYDLNRLAVMQFSDEDRMQFAQLIGYSVSGYGDLDYASSESVQRADEIAAKLLPTTTTE